MTSPLNPTKLIKNARFPTKDLETCLFEGLENLLKHPPHLSGGYEQRLDEMVRWYRGWTHGLHLKYPFDEIVERIEKKCHGKELKMLVKNKRWELYQPQHQSQSQHQDEEEGDQDEDQYQEEDQDEDQQQEEDPATREMQQMIQLIKQTKSQIQPEAWESDQKEGKKKRKRIVEEEEE